MDIKRHYLCLDFVTPTGENLLDVTSFADYNKCSGGLSGYYCDDQFSVICTRQSDGRVADYISKDNPTNPYRNFKISYPFVKMETDMSNEPLPVEGNYGVYPYICWKIGSTINVEIVDIDASLGDRKNFYECYNLTMVSQAIYGDNQAHNLRVYCRVRDGKPSVYRIEYDGSNDNLLDKDPFKRVAQQLGYHKDYSNGFIFVPIVVERQ